MSGTRGAYAFNRYRFDWLRLRANLTARYSPERAAVILASQDTQANADIEAWRSLGKRGEAA